MYVRQSVVQYNIQVTKLYISYVYIYFACAAIGGLLLLLPDSAKLPTCGVNWWSKESIQAMGYYDIMILGLTGLGKTTTAEKLLIANPTRVDYRSIKGPEMLDKIQDLSAWCVSDHLEQNSTRMRNLSLYRSLENPHLEINAAHESGVQLNGTTECDLFSNETTKVRVLDTPGFLAARHRNKTLCLKAQGITNILKIQTAMRMRFKRILYFLPCRDTLQISSLTLQHELQLMYSSFGRSVFNVMVLVATLGPSTYA